MSVDRSSTILMYIFLLNVTRRHTVHSSKMDTPPIRARIIKNGYAAMHASRYLIKIVYFVNLT